MICQASAECTFNYYYAIENTEELPIHVESKYVHMYMYILIISITHMYMCLSAIYICQIWAHAI